MRYGTTSGRCLYQFWSKRTFYYIGGVDSCIQYLVRLFVASILSSSLDFSTHFAHSCSLVGTAYAHAAAILKSDTKKV